MGNTIGSLTETIDAAGTINGVQETETLAYSVASDGTVQGLVQAQITVNGTTLTFH
jgi:hypothetical protein